jgi:hypothetical protein
MYIHTPLKVTKKYDFYWKIQEAIYSAVSFYSAVTAAGDLRIFSMKDFLQCRLLTCPPLPKLKFMTFAPPRSTCLP